MNVNHVRRLCRWKVFLHFLLTCCVANTNSNPFALAVDNNGSDNSSLESICENSNMKNPPALHSVNDDTNERRLAARRLAKAALSNRDISTESKSTLIQDLTLLFQDSLEEYEVLAIAKEVQQKSTTDTTNHKSSTHFTGCQENGSMFSANRHAAAVLDTYRSFDCIEREFDVNDPNFDTEEATKVLEKCRILILRNVFSKRIVDQTLAQYQRFTHDVRSGRIHRDGTTTYGGEYFILKEDNYRLNYMIPRELASPDILANQHVLEILSNYRLLDEDFIVNHSGTLNAQPGAPPQAWHADSEYLYGDESFEEYGVAGQDLPPFAISMFTPLLNMTNEHGPTEFCLGTAHFRGHGNSLHVHDHSFLENGVVSSLHSWDATTKGESCPHGFRRTPLLRLGDVVLFDYMVSHRGGRNKSTDLRSMLFTVYSRKWYKDWTFDINNDEEKTEFERLTEITRFAVIERTDDE